VFLPLLTLQGLEGKFFVPVALTIVFALASSLLLSLTVIPVLSSFLLKKVRTKTLAAAQAAAAVRAGAGLCACAAALVYGVAAADAGAAAGVYTLVGKTFMPTMDEGDIIVGIEKLPSVSLEETAALDLKIQQALMKAIPEITGVVARAGSDEIGLDPMGLNQTDTFLCSSRAKSGSWRTRRR
jgi:cobalt-zinc-cadmium resistance protein CzcA